MVSPHARDLVDQRLGGVRIGIDIGEREIGIDISPGQRREREGDERELRQRRRLRRLHQPEIAGRCAIERHARLIERRCERQHQRQMSELGDHGEDPSFHTPLAFSASATSLGM